MSKCQWIERDERGDVTGCDGEVAAKIVEADSDGFEPMRMEVCEPHARELMQEAGFVQDKSVCYGVHF